MGWSYAIVKPLTFPRTNIYGIAPCDCTFNPGEIDQFIYEFLVKRYPEHVQRTPTDLLTAVQSVRGGGA